MQGVNKVILIGTIGNDVETRAMRNGNAVANLRMCTNTRWRDRQTGERHETTEWHSVVLFGKMAEFVARHAKKGSRMYVDGYLQTRRRTLRDGSERAYTEVVAREAQLLRDGRDRRDEDDGKEPDGNVRDPAAGGDGFTGNPGGGEASPSAL